MVLPNPSTVSFDAGTYRQRWIKYIYIGIGGLIGHAGTSIRNGTSNHTGSIDARCLV